MADWTIQKLLAWIMEYFTDKKVDSPRLSAELLLASTLSMSRIELYTQFDKIVPKDKLVYLRRLVKRASQNEPVAYLIGKTEFYSIELDITGDCLIPRPETELLVEMAVDFLRKRAGKQLVCDLCTGCGCIAVAVAKNFAGADIIATDISEAALKVAEKNVEKYKFQDRIKLLCGDLFDPLIEQIDAAKFDLIVCNPPYVSTPDYQSLEKNVKDFEPQQAFYGGDDGLDIYQRIAEKSDDFLKPDAGLILEIGYGQGQAVKELLEKTSVFSDIKVEKDFQNNDRVVIARKTANNYNDKVNML
jgi:release factor glutamine methyltransferase